MSDNLVNRIRKHVEYISMMVNSGYYIGTPYHINMAQGSVYGIMKLLEQTKELDAAIAMDLYDVLAAKLKSTMWTPS